MVGATRGALALIVANALLAGAAPVHAQAKPDVEAFESALEQRLQKLKPSGSTERDVRFVAVQAGSERNGAYPFRASVVIRDYGPGYPANRYYGETCVGKLVDQTYWLRPDAFGGWQVEGTMTPDLAHRTCTKNPSAGVSSVPAASLDGRPAGAASSGSTATPAKSARPVAASPAGESAARRGSGIATGEWACYGAGGRALIGLAFRVNGDGSYTDLDGKTRGTYAYDASTGTLSFSGGHLDRQVGRPMGGGRFNIGTVTCEPYR